MREEFDVDQALARGYEGERPPRSGRWFNQRLYRWEWSHREAAHWLAGTLIGAVGLEACFGRSVRGVLSMVKAKPGRVVYGDGYATR